MVTASGMYTEKTREMSSDWLGERMLVSLAAEHGINTEKEGEGRSDSKSKRLRET